MEHQLSIEFLIIILAILILISAIFSGSETALMAVNRYRLHVLARQGNKRARLVQKLLSRPDRLLGVILTGNTCTNVMASSILTMIAVRLFDSVGLTLSVALLTLVILVFAEVLPKTLAVLYAQGIALRMAWVLKVLLAILYPVVWVINGVANTCLSLFGIQVEKNEIEPLSDDELKGLLTVENERLSNKNRAMLLGILDLEHTSVNDVMIPKNEVEGLDIHLPWKKIVEKICASSRMHMVVYEENLDRVHGVVSLGQIITLLTKDTLNKSTLLHACEPVAYIPEKVSLSTQLQRFQGANVRLGLVTDEYGDVLGMISFEDILEEILGNDLLTESSMWKAIKRHLDGSVTVLGSVNVRDLNRLLDWDFPTEGPNTLSGLVIEELEAIPENLVGCYISGYPVEIVNVKDNIIESLKVYPHKRKMMLQENGEDL